MVVLRCRARSRNSCNAARFVSCVVVPLNIWTAVAELTTFEGQERSGTVIGVLTL